MTTQLARHLAQCLHAHMQLADHCAGGGRKAQIPPALEQGIADLVFQSFDVLTDGAGRHVQLFSGPGKGRMTGDRLEGLQAAQGKERK